MIPKIDSIQPPEEEMQCIAAGGDNIGVTVAA